MQIKDFELVGNYSFDGAKNVEIHHAKMLSKDAFWNTENVTVYDSFISGEYLGWNAKNLTLINCTIESLQGMCYIQEKLRLLNTTVNADIKGKVESVLNPKSGTIKADCINKLTLEEDKVDSSKTEIICSEVICRLEHAE